MSVPKYEHSSARLSNNNYISPYQAQPRVTVVIPQPHQTVKAFEAKGSSIALLIMSCITFIPTFLFLNTWYALELPIPIIAGVLGIVSSKHPSTGKIVAFMVLSIITSVIAFAMFLVCIGLIINGATLLRLQSPYADYVSDLANNLAASLLGFGILGVIFYITLAILGVYCSVLCCKYVGCCGCSSEPENPQTSGSVLGQIHQPGGAMNNYLPTSPPGGAGDNYLPTSPPPYIQGIHQA